MSAMTPLRLALAQSTVDPTLISAWACLEIYIRAPYPPPSDDYGLHRGGLQEIKSSCPCLSMSVTASPHCPPPPLLPLRLKSWHPLSSLSLASSLAEAVLPDRALYLPTFGHFLIVNKTSLSLSPLFFLSLSLSLSLFLSCLGTLYRYTTHGGEIVPSTSRNSQNSVYSGYIYAYIHQQKFSKLSICKHTKPVSNLHSRIKILKTQ